jgi:hypothetical protein
LRYLHAIAALAIPVPLLAAPRLVPKPSFESAKAEVYPIYIGPMEIGKIELKASYSIRGKKGSKYVIELYLEVDSTGEKATMLRSTTVTLNGRPTDEEGTANGEFKVRSRLPDEAESSTHPDLPYPLSARLWSFFLVMREGNHVIACTASEFVPFIRKPIHVPE